MAGDYVKVELRSDGKPEFGRYLLQHREHGSKIGEFASAFIEHTSIVTKDELFDLTDLTYLAEMQVWDVAAEVFKNDGGAVWGLDLILGFCQAVLKYNAQYP